MPIKTVVSYKNAWKLFLDSYPEEYQEILQSISTDGWKGIEQIINDYQQSNFLVKARMISKARLSNLSIKKYKGFIDSLRKLSWTEKRPCRCGRCRCSWRYAVRWYGSSRSASCPFCSQQTSRRYRNPSWRTIL